MALNPISVVNSVLTEYRDYLETEFRARDENLRKELENALARDGFLAQEPFFQAHRPFMSGKAWKELGLDSRLAGVMEKRSDSKTAYSHQSNSILHLLSEKASPLVVTTGTGSGKTECFLLPVIQNAIDDSVAFGSKTGITAIVIYPMNALANDQEIRIREFLKESGHEHVKVSKYDRQTKEEERAALRRHPPHILLTNYMMLEYLLVRPADREALFENHRCRFVVLDEVHTYRGALGANIALLLRRLFAHLNNAAQNWKYEKREDVRRFPNRVVVGTSATIKSVDEEGLSESERRQRRDQAVREFFGTLTGIEKQSIRVEGEELTTLDIPPESKWAEKPTGTKADITNLETIAKSLAALASLPENLPPETISKRAAVLWALNNYLARKPMSVSGIVEKIKSEIDARKAWDANNIREEVECALKLGSALPDGMHGALRLRTHRFIRGGWKFHRCLDPKCGKLYAKGEEECSCGTKTAPLLLCRACGADAFHLQGAPSPDAGPLSAYGSLDDSSEWVLYFAKTENADDEFVDLESQMRGRHIHSGSFDPAQRFFSADETAYPYQATLAPGRLRCLACGGSAGTHDVVTPVSLGTSAAVRVLSEGLVEALGTQNRIKKDHDGKERLLIFADSRQDAAHQARFISYAGRYDRMRRRVVHVLEKKGALHLDQLLQELVILGVDQRDNPHTLQYQEAKYLPDSVKIKAKAWEEAPLLDDLATELSPLIRTVYAAHLASYSAGQQ